MVAKAKSESNEKERVNVMCIDSKLETIG